MGKNTKPVWDECKHTWKIVVWVMVWSKPCCCFICRYGYTKWGGEVETAKDWRFSFTNEFSKIWEKKNHEISTEWQL